MDTELADVLELVEQLSVEKQEQVAEYLVSKKYSNNQDCVDGLFEQPLQLSVTPENNADTFVEDDDWQYESMPIEYSHTVEVTRNFTGEIRLRSIDKPRPIAHDNKAGEEMEM